MKYTYKKLLSIYLLLTIFLTSININVSASSLRERTIEKLLSLGATMDAISKIPEYDLKELDKATNISLDKKYYYVPDNPDNPESQEMIQITYDEAQTEVARINRMKLTRASDTEISSGGYLEQYVYIAESSSSGRHFVCYTADWLIMPFYSQIDVMGIAIDNATVVPGTVNASYYYVIDRHYNGGYQPNWKSGTITVTNFSTFSKGVAAKVDLVDNTIDNVQRVSTHHISMSYYITQDNKNIKSIAVAGYYQHQEKATSISPSIAGIGISVGISVSQSQHFTNMTPNPYTVLYL